MSRLLIKRVLVGTIAAIMFAAQSPLPALAATDETALAAAQTGVNYLAANQNSDGSIAGSFGGITDWAAIAIQADGQQAATFSNGGASALDFMKTDVPGPAAAATDVERKIIAVAAAGQDTKTFGSVNYDTALAGYHAGGQIGDPTLLSDDMFGVIAAGAAKDPALHDTAQDSLNYFLAHQSADGGFSYTTASCAYCGSDSSDTAVAIIAMQTATSIGLSNPGLAAAENNAMAYLLSTHQADGGFAADIYSPSDGDSTAWSLMALSSIGDTVHTQALAARDWLLANQNSDGGFSYGAYGITTSDTYTTAHAIIAILGTTWLLQPSPIHASSPPAVTGGAGSSATNPNTSPNAGTNNGTATLASTAASPGTPPAASNPQVLGVQEADKHKAQVKTGSKQDSKAAQNKASTSHSLYAALALGLIALIWYMLQSRRKPEGV